MKKVVIGILSIIMVVSIAIFAISTNGGAVNAETDNRAIIGFDFENEFFAESNEKVETIRVYINQVQTENITFTLSEEIGDYNIFNFHSSYTLLAGQSYVDIGITQNANENLESGIKLKEISISCDTSKVRVGDKYQYGDSEAYDKNFYAVIYDIDGDSGLILEGFPRESSEKDGKVSMRTIRTGDISNSASIMYKVLDYDTGSGKEILFANYNSVLRFEANEREKSFDLIFYDNNYLNLREAFKIQFYSGTGISKVYNYPHRGYAGEVVHNETINLVFDTAIIDDEPFSDKYKVRVQYYQPGTVEPLTRFAEGCEWSIGINASAINKGIGAEEYIEPFRLYFTIETGSTAAYYEDYTFVQNYDVVANIGYIDCPTAFSYKAFSLDIKSVDNNVLDGTKSFYVRFFVLGREDIMLQPIDTMRVDIEDNEYAPNGNTVSWSEGWMDNYENGVLTRAHSGCGTNIFISTDYLGVVPLSIPVFFEDMTAKKGIDYIQESSYVLMKLDSNSSSTFSTDLGLTEDFDFVGTRRFKISIVEEGLSRGVELLGRKEIYVDIIGRIRNDYNYIEYAPATETNVFNIGKNENLSFVLNRVETTAETTYIKLEGVEGKLFKDGEHFVAGFFPYAVNWGIGETKKTITFDILSGWTHDASGMLKFLDGNKQEFDDTYGENQKKEVEFNLYEANSYATYYIKGPENLMYLEYEYKYSLNEPIIIEVVREKLKNEYVSSTVEYYYTFEYSNNFENILFADRAEVGTHIAEISGTINFGTSQESAFIRITLPEPQVASLKGSKYINLKLRNAGERTFILENTSAYTDRYKLAKLKITNDTALCLSYNDITTTTQMVGVYNTYEQTDIDALFPSGKGYDSFGIELAPYHESNSNHTSIPYQIDVCLYAEYNMSDAGVEVWINGRLVPIVEILTYTYEYENKDGIEKDITYNYAYVTSVNLFDISPSALIMLKYKDIANAGVSLKSTTMLITAHNPYFVNGLENYSKLLNFNACEEGAEVLLSVKASTLLVDNETDVLIGEKVYITISRSYLDLGADTLFFSSKCYGLSSLFSAGNGSYYYNNIDTMFQFAPYERTKTFIFQTVDSRPEGMEWSSEATSPTICVYDYYNREDIISQFVVNIHEEWASPIIDIECELLTNEAFIHKSLGNADKIAIKFVLGHTYSQDIVFNVSGLDERIGNLVVTIPAEVENNEYVHYFTVDESNFVLHRTTIGIAGGAIAIPPEGAVINLYFDDGLKVDIVSEAISEIVFACFPPEETIFDENTEEQISIRFYVGSNSGCYYIYVKKAGNAVYGEDYTFRLSGESPNGGTVTYNESAGLIIVPPFMHTVYLYVVPIDDNDYNGDVVGEFEFYEIALNGIEYNKYQVNITFKDNEYGGDVFASTEKSQNEINIVFERSGNTNCSLTLEYSIVEIIGEYGDDYILTEHGIEIGAEGSLHFDSDQAVATIKVICLNPNERPSFRMLSNVIDGQLADTQKASLYVIFDEYIHRTYSSQGTYAIKTKDYEDVKVTSESNYNLFLLDYTVYYNKYFTNQEAKVFEANINTSLSAKESIYMAFNGSQSYVYTDTLEGMELPSGVNPIHWYDFDNDGYKDLLFVSTIDSFFGGLEEFDTYGQYGVFVLNLQKHTVIPVMQFTRDEALALKTDVYVGDLSGNGCLDIAIYVSTATDSVNRMNADSKLYIFENAVESASEDMFILTKIFDSIAYINNVEYRLYSASLRTEDEVLPRVAMELIYYRGNGCGIKVEIASKKYAVYISTDFLDKTNSEVIEGNSLQVSLRNPFLRAGTVTLTFTSEDGINGRDFMLPETIDVVFTRNQIGINVIINTVNNNLINSNYTIHVEMSSNDFYLGNITRCDIHIVDCTVINKAPAYTILGEFSNSFESSNFVTGDSALFSIVPLTINGKKLFNEAYEGFDTTFKVKYDNTVWSDDDGDGYIEVFGLIALYRNATSKIILTVYFLEQGTQNIILTKDFYIDYLFSSSSNTEVINSVVIDTEVFAGEYIDIVATSSICIDGRITKGKFSLNYGYSLDGTKYISSTFESDCNGYIIAQINTGSQQGIFTQRYSLLQQTLDENGEDSTGESDLYVYLETMDYPISVVDTINRSLMKGVKIEVYGINVAYTYEGNTSISNGTLIITGLIPYKNYRFVINGDGAFNFFGVYEGSFEASYKTTGLTIDLPPNTDEHFLDNIMISVFSREEILDCFARISKPYSPYDLEKRFGIYANYLKGKLTRRLTAEEQYTLEVFYEYIFIGANNNKLFIDKNVFFSKDYQQTYKALAKNATDYTIIFYRHSPLEDFGEVNVNVSGKTLEKTAPMYSEYYFRHYYITQWTMPVSVYTFTGCQDSLIDIEIISSFYENGKKTIQLACFGTGLGNFLLEPIKEIFSSLETVPIPDGYAFINGMSFVLGFTDADFSSDYDEEAGTFSIFIGASKDLYEASHGMDYGDIGRPTLAQLKAAKAGKLGTGRGEAGLGVGLGGKMIFTYSENGWQLTAGEIYFSVSVSYNYTKYILIPVVFIPAYFSATLTLTVGTTIYFDWNEAEQYTEVTGDLAISLALDIAVGVGIKGFIHAQINGTAEIEVVIQLDTGGTKLTLTVSGGVSIKFLFWGYYYSFGTASWSTQSDGYIERHRSFQTVQLSELSASNNYTGVASVYNACGTLEMEMAFGDNMQVQDIVVVENVYSESSLQIAELGDGTRMLVWINRDASRGENNAEVLNYIYYDGDSWSDVGVVDNTVTADLGFDLKAYNGKYAIMGTEVKEELSENATVSERLQKSDISLFVYDSNAKSFLKTIMTDNLFNDRQTLFDVSGNNGFAVIYRSENTNLSDEMTLNDFLCGEGSNNKLFFSLYDYNSGTWGEFTALAGSMPIISNMSLKVIGGIAYLAVECDLDRNFDTTEDREIYLIQYIFATGQTRNTRLTDNEVQDVLPSIMEFDGKAFIAYRSDDSVMYWYENSSYYVLDLPQNYTDFVMATQDDYAVLLLTMPVEGTSQVFACIMDKESMLFSQPQQVTYSNNPARNPLISFNVSEMTVYYCEDIYTVTSMGADEEYIFSVESNIKLTYFEMKNDLGIEVLPIDYAEIMPDEENTITVRINNLGNINVVNPTIMIYSNSELIKTHAVEGIVKGCGYLDVEISFYVSSNVKNYTFEVQKESLDEQTYENNTTSVALVLVDAAITEFELIQNDDGTISVKLTIENLGNFDIVDLDITVTSYSDITTVYDSQVLAFLKAGENVKLSFTVSKENIFYNVTNNKFWLKAFALTQGRTIYDVDLDDYDKTNNTKSFSATRKIFEDGSMLQLLQEEIAITAGEEGFINLIYTGDNEVSFSSNDTSVASVNGRNITALKAGTATITVGDGEYIKTINVTVTGEIATYTVTLPTSGGYTTAAEGASQSPITSGGSYTFVVALEEAYNQSQITVKANGVELTAVSGVYTIENITANQTVTIEGVEQNADETATDDTNAELSELTLNGGDIDFVLDAETLEYSVNVGSEVTEITLSLVAAGSGASVLINGTTNNHILLSSGTNTITVTVTAADGITTTTYTITINRAETPIGGGGVDNGDDGEIATLTTGAIVAIVVISVEIASILAYFIIVFKKKRISKN